MATATQDAVANNAMARMSLIPGPNTQTVRRVQQIYSTTISDYVAGQQKQLIINPTPVGIITKFIVKVTARMGNSGGGDTQTRVQNGAAAILSNVQYTDTSNQTRINTTGWHLNLLSLERRRRKWTGAATYDNNNTDGIGAAYGSAISAAPATLTGAAPGSQNFAQYYEVPLAYSDTDLRGAVLAAIINATQQLTLTVNPNFFVTSTDVANLADAGYQSDGAALGTIPSLTITVYQEYIDNFGNLALPAIDLGTQYLLQTSGGYTPVANTDLSIPYANFRMFMSTIVRYANNGVFNTGSDLNYLSIRTANQSDLLKMDPATWALRSRARTGSDMSAGYYAIDHREKPLYTSQAGNLSLIVNANAVGGANSFVTVGYEQLALMASVQASAAISSGN